MEQGTVTCRKVEVITGTAAHTPVGPTFDSGHGGAATPMRKKWALLWGLSGTVLSGLGFIALALFEQYNSNLRELERDLKHFHEVSGELVKKDSMQRCYEHLKDSFKELQASNAARARLEKELEASERDRREMAREVQLMRERLANVEGRQAATPILIPRPVEGAKSWANYVNSPQAGR